MMKRNISIILVILLLVIPQANAFWGFATKSATAITKISSSAKVLPADEIVRLSKLSDEVKGTAKVGKELGKLNLPNDVLEDTFIRIAIHQNKVTRKEAEGMFSRLSGTPGFRSTLRKIIGNSDPGTIGHLNELMLADAASANGFRVVEIGGKFNDGIKKGQTDIDLVLERGGKYFAIEAKKYASTTKIPMDKYRADLDTLVIYKRNHSYPVIPVFAITDKPNDPQYLELLKYEAGRREVQLIFGTPQGEIEQIKLLGDIQ